MDAQSIQQAKNDFASGQNPPIKPCTNEFCKFTGCTCEDKCGCHIPKEELESQQKKHCDPCSDFKAKKKKEMEACGK